MNHLKNIRGRFGLTLRALSSLSGIGVSTLGNFENGKTNLSATKITALAETLGCRVEELAPQPSQPTVKLTVTVSAEDLLKALAQLTPDDKNTRNFCVRGATKFRGIGEFARREKVTRTHAWFVLSGVRHSPRLTAAWKKFQLNQTQK